MILLHDNPLLKEKCPEFDFENSELKAIDIAEKLTEEIVMTGAIGAAAPQIGILTRIFMFSHYSNLRTAINPKILDVSKEEVIDLEGCLSYPGLFIHKKRPTWVLASYYTCDSNYKEILLKDYDARCFLHELEHLDGILLLDNLSPLKKKMAMKKWQK